MEDVDPNGEDLTAEEQQHLDALLDSIRVDYPNWPTNASMVAKGTYTPTGADPIAFTTCFEAEIEIEVPLDPALEVTADGLPRTIAAPHPWVGRCFFIVGADGAMPLQLPNDGAWTIRTGRTTGSSRQRSLARR